MPSFAIIALIAATMFASAALYITFVEHPARLSLDEASALAQWKPSYERALPAQGGLAILGGFSGVIAWYYSDDWRWLAGSVVLLANWPYTLLAIMPVNKLLKAIEPTEAGAQSRILLQRWGVLHSVRSMLGSVAAILFAWGLFNC